MSTWAGFFLGTWKGPVQMRDPEAEVSLASHTSVSRLGLFFKVLDL